MDVESDDDIPLSLVARKNSVEDDDGGSSDSSSGSISEAQTPIKSKPLPSMLEAPAQPTIFEYEWPKNRSGSFFVVENELAKFLDVADLPGNIFYLFPFH